MGTSNFVGRFQVVQNVKWRIESAIAEDPAQSWESVRDRIKADFAEEFRVLYNLARINSPDGSDLIAEVVGGIAPQVRSATVGKMRDALLSATENAPGGRVLWSSTRQEIISANSAAIGMLAQHSQSAPDGDALLSEALQELHCRVWIVTHKAGSKEREYLTNRRPELLPPPPPPPPPPCWRKLMQAILPPWKWLKGLHIVLTTLAALATLIGVTVWDILPIPIPCDLPIFSLLPRC